MEQRLRLDIPEVFRPLWEVPARYKGAYGGRGSGKSHDRAAACVVAMLEGHRTVGVREIMRSIKDSVKQLVEDKIEALGVDGRFQMTRDEIRCDSGGQMVFAGLRDYSAESIKSLEGYTRCWVEEAQSLSARSLRLLTPTIRAPGSELWFTWNPRYKTDPVDDLLRGPTPPVDMVLVRANYFDNPFFPLDLRADMERDRGLDLAMYEHIWEGGYQAVGDGAYFAQQLSKARIDGRITRAPVEPGYPVDTSWDIGIDDCTAIWASQRIGREVILVDCFEDRGEDAAYYAKWVRDNRYDSGTAYLPHDAGTREKGTLLTYEDHVQRAGIERTRVIPQTRNLMADVEAVRSFMARCVWDAERCEEGLTALGAYGVEMDERLQTPKPRPVHNWASHYTDAFRILSNAYNWEAPSNDASRVNPHVRRAGLSAAHTTLGPRGAASGRRLNR